MGVTGLPLPLLGILWDVPRDAVILMGRNVFSIPRHLVVLVVRGEEDVHTVVDPRERERESVRKRGRERARARASEKCGVNARTRNEPHVQQ